MKHIIQKIFIFTTIFTLSMVGSFRMTIAEPNVYLLSLEETTRLALFNNFDVQLARYDAWIQRTQQKAAESVYDTVIRAEANYRKDKRKRVSSLLGEEIVDVNYNVGVSKKLPTGTTLDVEMTNFRGANNSPFAVLSPVYDSALGVSLQQELGKNFFGIQDRGNVKITKIDIENTEYSSIHKIEQELADVQKAYWSLVLAMQQEKIEEGMAEQARKLYQLNQEKLQDGLVETPEALASESNYQQRLNDLKLAQNSVQSRTNALRFLLNITDDDISISASDEFNLKERERNLKIDYSLNSAFQNRNDYKEVVNEIRSKNIQLVMKKNNLWPEINLTASLKRNGLGDDIAEAVRGISDEANPEFFAGITFNFPLENNSAESEYEAAQLEKAQALLNVKRLERQISIDIIDQVRTCKVLHEVAQNSIRVVELERKKFSAEERRFLRGRSDTDTLIRYQEDLLLAELRSAQAVFDYHDALVDLAQKEGSLINQYWDGEI